MDWWILKQLRAQILTDLKEFIPDQYFESEVERFQITTPIKSRDYLSNELRWGYLAARLGKRLFFESSHGMSARQVSASDVLMNLGNLVGAEAMQQASQNLANLAQEKDVPDCNAEAASLQLQSDYIPIFINNLKLALDQYVTYLSHDEALPFQSLISSNVSQGVAMPASEESVTKVTHVTNNINVNAPVTNLQAGESNSIAQTHELKSPAASIWKKIFEAVITKYVLVGLGVLGSLICYKFFQ